MNLELIQEINSLKNDNKTYTEIAEITGLSRTSIVLSLRLSKIFNIHNSQKLLSLNQDIELLKSTIQKYKDSFLEKEVEIKKLNSLIEIDYNRNTVISINDLNNLENKLEKSKYEIDTLKRKLSYKEKYLKNLSFIDKMKILFN